MIDSRVTFQDRRSQAVSDTPGIRSGWRWNAIFGAAGLLVGWLIGGESGSQSVRAALLGSTGYILGLGVRYLLNLSRAGERILRERLEIVLRRLPADDALVELWAFHEGERAFLNLKNVTGVADEFSVELVSLAHGDAPPGWSLRPRRLKWGEGTLQEFIPVDQTGRLRLIWIEHGPSRHRVVDDPEGQLYRDRVSVHLNNFGLPPDGDGAIFGRAYPTARGFQRQSWDLVVRISATRAQRSQTALLRYHVVPNDDKSGTGLEDFMLQRPAGWLEVLDSDVSVAGGGEG